MGACVLGSAFLAVGESECGSPGGYPRLVLDSRGDQVCDLAEATLAETQPVGPGSTVFATGSCATSIVAGPVDPDSAHGYDTLHVSCPFDEVDVNVYTVTMTVNGDGYYTATGQGAFTVYDPSLGHTTGGGWFYWPGSDDPETGYPGDRTNFGYTMKYGRNGKTLKGNLLMIRHLRDGTMYRLKSNALDALALGEDPTVPMGWASFSGKATYLDPTMTDAEGNHSFLVYVEDLDEPGTGTDRFWIKVNDKNRDVIAESSFDETAAANATTISGGNIVAPHRHSSTPIIEPQKSKKK